MAYSDYEFDPTGESPSNLISNEVQLFDSATTVVVIPDQGAFFGDSLTVEGRKDAGIWTEIQFGSGGYSFSPLFLDAAARTTRQLVYSYIVINPDVVDIDEIRLTYQAIGKYSDTTLFTEIAATAFDRTSPYEWLAFSGQSASFSPALRETSLKDVSIPEILSRQLELLTQAIVDPYATGRNYGVDITEIKLDLDNKLSQADLASFFSTPDTEATGVVPNVKLLYTFPNDKVYADIRIHVESSAGDVDVMQVILARCDNTIEKLVSNRLNNNGQLTTLTYVNSGNDLLVNGAFLAAGKFTVKVISEF